ncbi:hypothetical protein AOCH_000098 [Aspergillus ochraceoroseus]|uniref:Fe2OG dioxygenase domain-containing protein n=1 Tax=Aspergillus ochraceoroseus TaxID=138278 RepID=A0A0F8V1C2_9EURO|nr:hypothetical protein AOCH_000098 [Aspergillus ochraceoroseus]
MTVVSESFTTIPILDFSLSTAPETKASFLADLRNALVNVGFFYLTNAPVAPHVTQELVAKTKEIFDLPLEKKREIEMVHSKHFLGYSRLGAEITARKPDYREQFDFATELPAPPPEAPLYRNIRGPNQWPDEAVIPGFRRSVEAYLAELSPVADQFQGLIAEALHLHPAALKPFFEVPLQQKMKLIKYPPPSTEAEAQGVGAHKDSEFLTFLLQVPPHRGLEVQNKSGDWISAPPIEGSLVVNIGRALEAITGGVCTATTHRVSLEPSNYVDAQGRPLGPRFSIPVFQGMSLDLSAEDISLDIPEHIQDLILDKRVRSDAEATFNSMFRSRVGEGTLIHRVISHQDVGLFGKDIYVSPTGSDNAAGTIDAPLKSIQLAVDRATGGTTIYLRGGRYSPTANIQITKSGTSPAPYILRAYGGESVMIDGEGLPGTPAGSDASLPNKERGILHIEKADYWEFYDLELINGPYGVYAQDSSNNHYERIVTRDNYETGFHLQGDSSNNLVLYLDSYANRDPRKNGESADGFACKEGSGDGNVLRGARLWNNVDDGLDLWEFKSGVTIEDTISWGNGFNRWNFAPFKGDGNGFKLGGGNDGDIGPANHRVINSIAFGNSKDGFTDNSQPGKFELLRNTAWNNGAMGFRFHTAAATLTGNIAASNGEAPTSLSKAQISRGNSWNDGKTWNDASFVSVDTRLVQGARDIHGKIKPSDFLLPTSGGTIGATTDWND